MGGFNYRWMNVMWIKFCIQETRKDGTGRKRNYRVDNIYTRTRTVFKLFTDLNATSKAAWIRSDFLITRPTKVISALSLLTEGNSRRTFSVCFLNVRTKGSEQLWTHAASKSPLQLQMWADRLNGWIDLRCGAQTRRKLNKNRSIVI